ncbi:MAG: sigma-70 family RNA polymerase sigma factor [Thermoanaerobaculia bacterium]|nr:sigma-70 family RNA polymerase sigma factor [Thermoanaerobaculia bacterium]
MAPSPGRVTELLVEWSRGDRDALEELVPLVYSELRKIARQRLSQERPDHTLVPTALVHETYLRLAGQKRAQWHGRAHFFAVSAQLMRRILVDHARARRTAKREGACFTVALGEADAPLEQRGTDLLALDEALRDLEALDARQGRIVELRYFGGLTVEETARVLEISARTVKREWRMAKAWLGRELRGDRATGS